MKTVFIGFCLIACSLLSFSAHPIYLSTTEIDYNKKTKTLEIAIKIFSDDLGEALSDEQGTTIEIGTDREHKEATTLITEYLRKHFVIELNGKPKDFQYLMRKNVREDFYATWILLEVPKVRYIKSLKLTNNILVDFNDGQQNHVKFREDKSQSYARSVALEGYEQLTLK
ncbi:MAG: DUF6702 family protein [Aureispira sp.]